MGLVETAAAVVLAEVAEKETGSAVERDPPASAKCDVEMGFVVTETG